ncbi:MAG: BspA family leucine-rich repeat surface protein, partial [Muribaculaceae bacterium]|nr:BspA family leucine-rich repeat surface protein [Muribaculaceae bacterium]
TTLYFVSLPTDIMSDGTWDGQNITQVWYGNNVTNVGWSTPGWNSVKDNVTCVVFDESFAAVKPKSCYSWFFSFKNLATIEGLSNLNTADVNNMNSMFLSCKALTTIDVNTFDVSKVTNATAMFRQCENLTTIYCDSTWNISTSGSMFLGDTKLVGAVAYNSNYQGGNMANPVTGYFTGKWDINIADIQGGTVTCELSEAYTNETVTLTVAPNEGKVFDSLVVLCGTDTVAVTAGDNNQYTFVMPAGDVNVNATFTVKDECTLAEALKLDNGDAAKVVAPIIVAAIVGEHAYVTDNDGHWARLDFANAQTAESIVVGTCFDWFNGTLANRDTAPTFTVTDEEHDPNASEIVNIASINLANEFEMPELNEVVEFSGYYVNGKLRAYSNGEGQSLTLATDFAQPELVEGTYYTLRVGVEVEEPWSNPAPRRVKLAYDYDFQNLKGQMIEVVNDQMPTAINSVNADKVGDNKWYTIDGRVLNTKPTSTGIYIHNGRKVIVK